MNDITSPKFKHSNMVKSFKFVSNFETLGRFISKFRRNYNNRCRVFIVLRKFFGSFFKRINMLLGKSNCNLLKVWTRYNFLQEK